MNKKKLKSLMWVCNCESPLPDLMYFRHKTCEDCGAIRPTEYMENIKKMIRARISREAGLARAESLSPERRKEIALIASNKRWNK